jgi:DAK2 domain fusion protein YloV
MRLLPSAIVGRYVMSEKLFDAQIVRRWAQAGVNTLREHRNELNALNVFPVPDGDTGTNLYLTFKSAYEAELQRTGKDDDAVDALRAMARGALLGARGNSGVILAQTLAAFAETASTMTEGLTLRGLLTAGATAARSAVAAPIEGTALTVLDAAAATDAREPSTAASAARETLGRTPEMLEVLKHAGVVDAGGRGVVLLLDALNAVWHGTEIASPPVGFVPSEVPFAHACEADARFEVMFIVPAQRQEAVRNAIIDSGVSLAITAGREFAQVHIHADVPSEVLSRAKTVTDIRNVRIELLEQQVTARKIVAQAFGSGVVQQLAELGVVVVAAEPDTRPSVQDFYSAGIRANAREVILLSSDKDSIQVAEIAIAELRKEGIDAVLVPTLTLIHSIAAIAVANPDVSLSADAATMKTAAESATAIGITQASRDSSTPKGEILRDDFLGFVNAELTTVSRDFVDALCEAAVNAPRADLITLISGSHISQADFEDADEAMRTMFPDAEIVHIAGHQEVWPLLVGIE